MCPKSPKLKLPFLIVLIGLAVTCHGQLKYGFYNGKCGKHDVEAAIRSIVTDRFATDRKIVAGLLRMQFHDCFVHGCDGSILLDGPYSEKNAGANLSMFGYDLIDQIKVVLEALCPGVVSCSDIIISATRDSSILAGGAPFQVQMGRRDGLVSLASLVNLPPADIPVPLAIQLFWSRGLNPFDMVLLLGAHTCGVTHCSVINNRLYNYMGTGRSDPSANPLYTSLLKKLVCPIGRTFDNIVFLDDQSSVLTVDNSYYKQLLNNKGVLQIDQALALDGSTRWMVEMLANSNQFKSLFARALVKLGGVGVLTGNQGQIRRNCRRIN